MSEIGIKFLSSAKKPNKQTNVMREYAVHEKKRRNAKEFDRRKIKHRRNNSTQNIQVLFANTPKDREYNVRDICKQKKKNKIINKRKL